MKKIIYVLLLINLLFLSGCGSKSVNEEQQPMNKNTEITENDLENTEWFFSNTLTWWDIKNISMIQKNGKYNIIDNDTKELLFDEWFDMISNTVEWWENGNMYFLAIKDNKYNMIDNQWKIIFDKWYDNVWFYSDGYALILDWDKVNYINEKWEFISDDWYDAWYEFISWVALVKKDNNYYLLSINGDKKLLSYDSVDIYSQALFLVKKWGRMWFIDRSWKLVWWTFDKLLFSRNSISIVQKDWKYNYVWQNGELLFGNWFDTYETCNDGFNIFWLWEDKYLITEQWKLIRKGSIGFECATSWFIKIYENWEYNYLDINGKKLFSNWFDNVEECINWYVIVMQGNKKNILNTSLKMISNTWFDDAKCGIKWQFLVKLWAESYLINRNGEKIEE